MLSNRDAPMVRLTDALIALPVVVFTGWVGVIVLCFSPNEWIFIMCDLHFS